jgi:7-keto-8-aminopelargonate synthetase-like enzyme
MIRVIYDREDFVMSSSQCTLDDRIIFDDTVFKTVRHNPYYLSVSSDLADPVIVEGKSYINLASNNYLGLANDARLKDAYIDAITRYGVSMCATPIAGGYTDLFHAVQQSLSSFIGVEEVLVYPSCYQANNGIFSALAKKSDVIIFDRCAHASLIQGIRSVGCRAFPFSHNDMECLDYALSKAQDHTRIFVVTESVFSTEGSIAPFRRIYDLCMSYGAVPVVDDSHGIGVIGNHGRGILEYSGIENYQGIYTTSLGKAFANNCGVVGGVHSLIEYLRYFSGHLVYSTAVAPCVLAGVLQTIRIVEQEFTSLARTLYSYHAIIKNALRESGYDIVDSMAPINAIKAGSTEETIAMAKQLFDNGIFCTPFVYPSVPKRGGRVRLIAGANLREGTIERAVRTFRTLGES